jgi:hypothetical protein
MGRGNHGLLPRSTTGISVKPYRYREGKWVLKVRDASGKWCHCGVFETQEGAQLAGIRHKLRFNGGNGQC